jgi:hypothetical protein
MSYGDSAYATPITDLIVNRLGRNGTDEQAQALLNQIFSGDHVSLDDVLDIENYQIQDRPQQSMPSDNDPDYETKLDSYKKWLVSQAALALSEIDKNEQGQFASLRSTQRRIEELEEIFDGDSDRGQTATERDERVGVGREILKGIPVAAPDPHISIDEDTTYNLNPVVFGFVDPQGNSGFPSSFRGIYVKARVDLDNNSLVDLLHDGARLNSDQGIIPTIPNNITEQGFYYLSSEHLSRLSIRPSENDFGILDINYRVFDGEDWSNKAVLKIEVNSVNDSPDIKRTGTQNTLNEGTIAAGTDTGYRFTATDADNPTATPRLYIPTFELNGTPINNLFEIDANGRLLFAREFDADFENLPAGQIVYTIFAEDVLDGGGPGTQHSRQQVSIEITNVDETDASVNISRTTGTGDVAVGHIYTATVTHDEDNDDTTVYTYNWYLDNTLQTGRSGTTANTFTIGAGDGDQELRLEIVYTDLGKTAADNPVTVAIPDAQRVAIPVFPDSRPTFTNGITSDLNRQSDVGDTVTIRDDYTDINGVSSKTYEIYYGRYDYGITDLQSLRYGTPRGFKFGNDLDASSGQASFNLDINLYEQEIFVVLELVDDDGNTYEFFKSLGGFDAGDTPANATPLTSVGHEHNGAIIAGGHFINENSINDVDVFSFTLTERQSVTFTQNATSNVVIDITDLRFTILDSQGNTIGTPVTGSNVKPARISAVLDGAAGGIEYILRVESVGGNEGMYGFNYVATAPNVILPNVAPTFTADYGAGPNVDENDVAAAILGFKFTPRDVESSNFTFEFVSIPTEPLSASELAALFEVVALSGNDAGSYGLKLKTGQSLDHEAKDTYGMWVKIIDEGGLSVTTGNVIIRVGNVDEDDATVSIARTTGSGAVSVGHVYTATVTHDGDNDDSTVYTFNWYLGTTLQTSRSGTSANTFTIQAGDDDQELSLEIVYTDLGKTAPAPDNRVTVSIPDAQKVSIPNLNFAPTVVLDTASGSIDENAVAAAIPSIKFTPSDTPGTNYTFEILPTGSETLDATELAALFEVVALTGSDAGSYGLKLKDGQSLNYEAKDTYSVRIKIIDDGSLFVTTGDITLNVGNVNEHAPVIEQTDTTQDPLSEGTYVTATNTGYVFSITDADRGTPIVTISDTRFELDGSGNLRIKANQTIDYDTLTNGVLEFTITATDDGTGSGPDPAPLPPTTVRVTFSEIQTLNDIEVYEGHPTYKAIAIPSVDLAGYELILGYKDNGKFTIDADGDIRWNKAPDFEAPDMGPDNRDENGDNRYEIKLRGMDNGQPHFIEADIVVQDISITPSTIGQGQTYRPGFGFHPRDIPNANKPDNYEFFQHVLQGGAWALPTTGPLIITYSFYDSARDTIETTWTGQNRQENVDRFYATFKAALLQFERAANIKFIEIQHEVQDTEFDTVPPFENNIIPHIAINSFTPGSLNIASTGFEGSTIGFSTGVIRDYRTDIIIHEIGHALHLSHPHNYSNSLDQMPSNFDPEIHFPRKEEYSTSELTVMSYAPGRHNTLQQADIDVLQFLYGAPGTDFAGIQTKVFYNTHSPVITKSGSQTVTLSEGTFTTATNTGFMVSATDADGGTVEFSITDSNGRTYDDEFEIVGGHLRIKTGATIDYEKLTNGGEFRIVASDTGVGAGPDQPQDVETVTLNFANVNDNIPDIVVRGGATVLLNVGANLAGIDTGRRITATDPDDPTGSPTLLVSDDRFEINQQGWLVLARNASFDQSELTGVGWLSMTITAEDTGVGTGDSPGDATMTVRVFVDSRPAPDPTSPINPRPNPTALVTTELDFNVDEGQSMIANLGEFRLINPIIGYGADLEDVQIRQTDDGPILEFKSPPDFDIREDHDQDNVYEFTILGDFTSIDVDVTIEEIDDPPNEEPTNNLNHASGCCCSHCLQNNHDPDQYSHFVNLAVNESENFILNLYSFFNLSNPTISGEDVDDVQFRQAPKGLVLEFTEEPDYEAPEDHNRDNVYEFTINDDLTTIEFYIMIVDL